MPRSIWNGTVAFGLVNVPVKVHSATQDSSVHFHEVHLADGARIEHKRLCSKEHKEVPYDEVVKGYELKSGQYVVLSKEELDAAAGERSKVIEVTEFVPADEIDPAPSCVPTTSARGRRRARLPSAARRARAHRPGRDRPLDLPQPRLPGRDQAVGRAARPAHDAVRGRAGAAIEVKCLRPSASRASRRSTWRRCWSTACMGASTPSDTRTSTAIG